MPQFLKGAPWFLVLVLALLSGLAAWLERVVNAPAAARDGSSRHDPDYIIEQFEAQRYGPAGNLEYRLTAAHLEHYPDTDSSELRDARLVQMLPNQPQLVIVASRATLDRSQKRVIFNEGVIITQAAWQKQLPITLTTRNLTVWTDRKLAQTEAPLQLVQGSSRVDAVGMVMDQQARKITLKHHVRANYVQAK
ncbi:LPS export ABC transporter periplasmic protein LptC [Leeia sp.]|uniref:LPS export ABC transporter periplasmic protein LptC n=1 Tax=Leeia sp. TaxID=2884678 RepID=UPI0035AD8E0B